MKASDSNLPTEGNAGPKVYKASSSTGSFAYLCSDLTSPILTLDVGTRPRVVRAAIRRATEQILVQQCLPGMAE